jgi:hypothetical protein
MPDLAARCFHRRKLSYQIGEECAQGTKMEKKKMQDGAHSFAFRQVHNDRITAAILSKIAQNRLDLSDRIPTVRPFWVWRRTQSEQFGSVILVG